MFHLSLHFVVPYLVALMFFRADIKTAYLVMIATMAVDLDHLLATPIYDPARCSIGFHPLHSWPALLVYAGLCFAPALKLVGIGLVIHMLLDALDCVV